MNLHKNYKPILDKRRKLFILITKYQLLATAPLALSGCMGIYETSFECPPGRGVGCKSISEVNQLTDEGLGRSCSSPQEIHKPSENCPQPQIWYALEEA